MAGMEMLSLLWPFKALVKEGHSNGPGWKGCWVEKLNNECRGLAGVSRGCSMSRRAFQTAGLWSRQK